MSFIFTLQKKVVLEGKVNQRMKILSSFTGLEQPEDMSVFILG